MERGGRRERGDRGNREKREGREGREKREREEREGQRQKWGFLYHSRASYRFQSNKHPDLFGYVVAGSNLDTSCWHGTMWGGGVGCWWTCLSSVGGMDEETFS